jgi:hypothetical protein
MMRWDAPQSANAIGSPPITINHKVKARKLVSGSSEDAEAIKPVMMMMMRPTK